MTIDFELTKRAIARVNAKGNGTPKTGTAFYVGGKYAVTALHVVADTRAPQPEFLTSITLQFSDSAALIAATIVDELWSIGGDWVVLECEVPPNADAIELGPEPAQGMTWTSYGFPNIEPTGMTIVGVVRDARLRPLPNVAERQQHPVLQLFGEEPSSGMGARMHGFSGAPCLVEGKCAGILRSTLIEEVTDGQLQRHLFTQAGTIYATPGRSVVERQAELRKATLPGSWALPEILKRDFVVLLSQREPDLTGNADTTPRVALRGVAHQAYRNVRDRGLSEPYFLVAADAVSSEAGLKECVRALCNAKVVVFDATDFEPAIMLLAGIRAVVKRGVTLLSVGGDYALGKQLPIPFNIADANIVAHSREQNRSMIANSVALLTQRIARGLDAIRSPLYLDLPVFDAIRRLPADRRGIIPSTEGILVLCPFDEPYDLFWNENLKPAFAGELDKLRNKQCLTGPASFGVSRSFELNSPRLVTHAVYEAIRRAQSCVIDMSGWSANVLFELGVRLAASGERTTCIIEKDWEKKIRKEWLPQCRDIELLFVPQDFRYDPMQPWEGQAAFTNAYGPDALPPTSSLLDGGLHTFVEHSLDVDGEPASRPVILDLQDQAATFSRDPGSGGRSKPVGLFPGNPDLVRREAVAEFERLLAAWLFASIYYKEEEILRNTEIREGVYGVVQQMFARHIDRLTADVKGAAGAMMDKINEWRKHNG